VANEYYHKAKLFSIGVNLLKFIFYHREFHPASLQIIARFPYNYDVYVTNLWLINYQSYFSR